MNGLKEMATQNKLEVKDRKGNGKYKKSNNSE